MDMRSGEQIFSLKSKFEGGGRLEALRADLRPTELDLGLEG